MSSILIDSQKYKQHLGGRECNTHPLVRGPKEQYPNCGKHYLLVIKEVRLVTLIGMNQSLRAHIPV
jgi:hypothetical protein